MTGSSSHSERTFSPRVQRQIKQELQRLARFKDEVDSILLEFKPVRVKREPRQTIEHIISKFHTVVRQLQERQRERQPFVVRDEYDVQDLLHGLLCIYFEDIRREEYCPSYAGTSPRIDFFLRNDQIAIEAKMTRKDHRKKKITHELIIDKEYYRKKKDCKLLYCLVYDPEERITNPSGFEYDISENRAGFEVKVYVVPRK